MPVYPYRCPCGHQFERYQPLRKYRAVALCERCHLWAGRLLTAPIMVSCAQDVHYTSPIDNSPITSWDKRTEDLKRHDCVPYDPGMKEDYLRRMKESETSLDRSIDHSVERAVSRMTTTQRGRLHSELVEQGTDMTVLRGGK